MLCAQSVREQIKKLNIQVQQCFMPMKPRENLDHSRSNDFETQTVQHLIKHELRIICLHHLQL